MLKMKNFGETLKFERKETFGWQLVAFHCRESRNTVDSALNKLGYHKIGSRRGKKVISGETKKKSKKKKKEEEWK